MGNQGQYRKLLELVKAFLDRKATIGQLREFVRSTEKKKQNGANV